MSDDEKRQLLKQKHELLNQLTPAVIARYYGQVAEEEFQATADPLKQAIAVIDSQLQQGSD